MSKTGRQKNIRVLFGLGCLLLVFILVAKPAHPDQTLTPLQSRQPAPAFLLPDMNGRSHRLLDYRGKVVIVNFWASWCTPCRKELPSMNRAWEELKQNDVAMLAINVGEDHQAVQAFKKDFPIDFIVLLDSKGTTSQHWQVTGLPTTYVLDAQGRAVYRLLGSREWDDQELIRRLRALSGS